MPSVRARAPGLEPGPAVLETAMLPIALRPCVYAWGRIRTCGARSRRFYGPAAVPYGVPRVDVVERAAPVGTVARLARF